MSNCANHNDYGKELAIGYASEYLDYMDAVVETKDPVSAWNDWCTFMNIEHEMNSNPYI